MKIKAANILIIILLGIFLAHVVIPHHHHEQMVCVQKSHCENDSRQHSHKTSPTEHQHDGATDSQTCVLKQLATNQQNINHKLCKCVFCKSDLPIFIFAFIFSENTLKTVTEKFTSIIPYFQSDNSVLLTKSFGMRAPPKF